MSTYLITGIGLGGVGLMAALLGNLASLPTIFVTVIFVASGLTFILVVALGSVYDSIEGLGIWVRWLLAVAVALVAFALAFLV